VDYKYTRSKHQYSKYIGGILLPSWSAFAVMFARLHGVVPSLLGEARVLKSQGEPVQCQFECCVYVSVKRITASSMEIKEIRLTRLGTTVKDQFFVQTLGLTLLIET
jgi:hypothetical protein